MPNSDFDVDLFIELYAEQILKVAKTLAPGKHGRYGKIRKRFDKVEIIWDAYFSDVVEHGIQKAFKERYHVKQKDGTMKIAYRNIKPRPGSKFVERSQDIVDNDSGFLESITKLAVID